MSPGERSTRVAFSQSAALRACDPLQAGGIRFLVFDMCRKYVHASKVHLIRSRVRSRGFGV